MINLFVNYYSDKNHNRQKELDFCLKKNLDNKLLNTVVINSQERMTYNDYFRLIRDYSKDQNDINIISNLDIFFDASVVLVEKMEPNSVFALTRWDYSMETGETNFFNRRDSQDCWIFRGHADNVYGDFCLGHPGCDNRIAYEFAKANWKISNPSLSLKTYHVHSSNVRNYNQKLTVPGPYHVLDPTTL